MNSVVSFVALYDDLLVPKGTFAVLGISPYSDPSLLRIQLVINDSKTVQIPEPVLAEPPVEFPPHTIVTLELGGENTVIACFEFCGHHYMVEFSFDHIRGLRYDDSSEDSDTVSPREVEDEASEGISAFA